MSESSSRYSAQTPSPRAVFFAATPPASSVGRHARRTGSTSSGNSSHSSSAADSPSNLAFNARAAAMAASTAPLYAAAALRSPQAIAASQYPVSASPRHTPPIPPQQLQQQRPQSSHGRWQTQTQSPVGWASPPPRPRSSQGGAGGGSLFQFLQQHQHQRHWSTPPPSHQLHQHALPRTSPRSAAAGAASSMIAAPVALSRAQLLAQWSAEKSSRSSFLNGSLYLSAAPPALPYSPLASTASNSQVSSTSSLLQQHQWSSQPQPHPPPLLSSRSVSPGHSHSNGSMLVRPPSSSRPHTPASALKGGRALQQQHQAHLRAASAVSAYSDGSILMLDDLSQLDDPQQQDGEQVFIIRPTQPSPLSKAPRPSAASPFGSYFNSASAAASAGEDPSLALQFVSPDRSTAAASNGKLHSPVHAAVSAHVARARMLREQRAALADQDALVPSLPLLLGSGSTAASASASARFAAAPATPPPGPHDPLPIEPHLMPAPSAAASSSSPSHSHSHASAAVDHEPPHSQRWQVAEDHFWCSWTATRCCDARALSLDAQLIRLASFCATERGASLLSSPTSPAALMLHGGHGSIHSSSSQSSMLDLTSAELASLLLIAPLPLLLCLLDCYIAAGRSFLAFSALEHALSLSVSAQLSRWRSTTMEREGILVPPASDSAWQSYLTTVVRPFVQSMETAARDAEAQRRQQEAEEERRAHYIFGLPPPPKPEETAVAREGHASSKKAAQEEKQEEEAAEKQAAAAAAAAKAKAEAKKKKLAAAAAAASASQPLSPAHLQRLESLETEIRQLRAQLQSQSGNSKSSADDGTVLHAAAPHARQTADSSSPPAVSSSASRRASATSSSSASASATATVDAGAGASSDAAVTAPDGAVRAPRSRSRRASQEPAKEEELVVPKARSARRSSGPGPTIGTTVLPDTGSKHASGDASALNSKPASGTAAAQTSNAGVSAESSSAASSTAAPFASFSDSASGADNGTILSFLQPRKGHAHSPSIVPEECDSDVSALPATPTPNPTDRSADGSAPVSAAATATTSPRFVPKALNLSESSEEGEVPATKGGEAVSANEAASTDPVQQASSAPSSGSLALQQRLTDWAVSDQTTGAGASSSSRPGSGPLPYRPMRPLTASSFSASSAPSQLGQSSDAAAVGGPSASPSRDLSHNSPHSLREMAARNAAMRNSGSGLNSEVVSPAGFNRVPARVMSIDTKYETMGTRNSRSASPPGSPFSSPSAAAAGILLSPALHVRRAGSPQTPPEIPGGMRSRSGSLSSLGNVAGGGGGAGGGAATDRAATERGGSTTPSRAMTPRPRLPAPVAVVVGPVPVQRTNSSSVPTTPGAPATAAATTAAPGHSRGHSRFASRGGSLTPLPLSSLVSSGVLPTATATEQQELLEAVLHDYPAPETSSVVAATARSRANSVSKRSAATADAGIDSFRRHATSGSGSNSNSTAILPLDELNEQNLPLFASTVREESTSTSSTASAGSNAADQPAVTVAAATGGGSAEPTAQSEAPVAAAGASPPSAVDSILSAAALASPAAAAAPVAVPNLSHPVVTMEQVASFLLWASPSLFFSPSRMRTTLTTSDVEYLVQIAHTELSALQHLQALQKLSKQYEDFHALLLAVHELQTFRVHRRDYVVASLSYPRCTLFSRSASAVVCVVEDIDWLVDACNGEVEWIDYTISMLDVHGWRVCDDPPGMPGALGGFGKLMKIVYKLYGAVGEEQKKLKRFLTFDPEASGAGGGGSGSADSRRSSSTSDSAGGSEIQYPVPLRLLRDSNNLPRTMDSSEVDDLCHRLKPLQHVSGLWAFMRREQAKAVAEHNWMQKQAQQQTAEQQASQTGDSSAPKVTPAAPASPLLHKAASGFRVDLAQAAALATERERAAVSTAAASSDAASSSTVGAPLFPPLESALPPLLLLQSFALDRLSFRTPLTLFQALWECGDYPPVPPFIHRAVGLMEPVMDAPKDAAAAAAPAERTAEATGQATQQRDGAAESAAASSQQLSQPSSIVSATAVVVSSTEDQTQCRTVRAKLREMARRKEINEAQEAARIVAREAAEAKEAAAAAAIAAFVPSLPATHSNSPSANLAAATPSASPTATSLYDTQ